MALLKFFLEKKSSPRCSMIRVRWRLLLGSAYLNLIAHIMETKPQYMPINPATLPPRSPVLMATTEINAATYGATNFTVSMAFLLLYCFICKLTPNLASKQYSRKLSSCQYHAKKFQKSFLKKNKFVKQSIAQHGTCGS